MVSALLISMPALQGNVSVLQSVTEAPVGAPAEQPALQIGNPGAVAYDTKRNEILVPN